MVKTTEKGCKLKIEAEINNLKKILVDDENFYQIPDYQRPYSWDKDNLSDLIDDLKNSYLDNKNENYFCGSLVLVKNDDDLRYDIIDGQQRITTFTIISCIFRDVYFDSVNKRAQDYIKQSIQDQYDESKRKLKFLTDIKYQNSFEQTVLKKIDFKDVKNIEKEFPDNKYLQNAYHINNFIKEILEDNDIDINEFIIWFYENIVLTVITCPSQDTAIQIFNVLNDRGMPLSSIDILKSSLMQKLQDNKEDRHVFKTVWADINSELTFNNLDIENMLNTYLYYKITTNPKSRLDKELLKVFAKEKRGALDIINEIKEFSKSYIQLHIENDKNTFCLKYLRHKVYWISILSTALHVEYKDIDQLKELLVAYYYQNWIAGATVARIKQTSFNVLTKIKNNESISDIKLEMKKNLDKYQTTKNFQEALKYDNVYGNKWDKSLLLLVEYFSDDNQNPTFIPINSRLHLEHILPQEPTQHGWDKIFTTEELDKWTNSLANLTLLSMRKNIQAQNFSFFKKKDAYQNKDNVETSFRITQKILNKSKWNVEELENRELELVEKINEKINLF